MSGEMADDSVSRYSTNYFELAEAILLTVDRDGRVEQINPYGAGLLGYSPSWLANKPWIATCMPQYLHAWAQQVLREIIDGKHPMPAHYISPVINAAGEERLINWLCMSRTDQDGEVTSIVSTGVDITEQIKLREELASQRREVQQARNTQAHMDRVHIVAEMSSSIAHELNQPITAIANYSEAALRLLGEKKTDHDALSRILKHISEQSHRTGEILDSLRNLVSKRESRRKPVDVNRLIRDTLKLLKLDSLSGNTTFETDLEKNIPRVLADGTQLQQVLFNLVRNGLEAMNDNDGEPSVITVTSSSVPGNMVTIGVSDCGDGVPVGERDRIFQPFHSTKDFGMGMGLNISRSIVENHGGTLSLNHRRRKGAEFVFTLPVYENENGKATDTADGRE